MWLLLITAAIAGSMVWLVRSVAAVRTEQVQRGLFGESAREALIQQWVDAVVEGAEREVRLAHLGSSLRSRAWDGAIAEIGPAHHGRDSTWQFSTGEVWRVDLTRGTPRSARRVVVRSVDDRGPDLLVRAYVPGGIDLTLRIVDARVVEPARVPTTV